MWKDLTMSQRADMMDLYLSKGITSLDDMRSLYDSSISDTAQGTSFSDGGSIHIKPENRGKFTALKERTGHSATWFKEHGTPAQKKMATFALNARHWKHGYGGNIYDGTTEDTQQMNIPYAGELPDVTVMPRRIANKAWDKVQERWVGDMPTYYAVNPETGKEEMLREIGNGKYSTYDDKHVFDVLGAEAAKKQKEQWIKNGGNAGDFDKVILGTLGLGLAPIALPEIAAGVGTALANPYVDAGLTSYFGAHGLNHAINEGVNGWGDAAMTALEVAPLGRLVKPIYEGVVQPGMRLFNSPLTGNWTTIGNREYRLSPNSLGANGSSIEQRIPQITAENAASMTPEQWTAAQDAAIARGNMAEAQRLRDLHFMVNTPGNVVVKEGKPTHNYHGTQDEFNTFDINLFGRTDNGDRGRGFYFSENKDISRDYGPIIKDVYLYAKTPYKGFKKEKYLGRGKSKDEVVQYLTKLHRKDLEDTVKYMINQQKSGSHSPMYDDLGITKDTSEQEIRNLVNKAYNHEDVIPYEVGNLDEADVFLSPYENVVYKPNQIKSADAVTYDDNGVRIPLGERDNFSINDIRYGLLPFGIGLTGYGLYNSGK